LKILPRGANAGGRRRKIAMDASANDYVVIKAKDNGVHVIGLTRGQDTRFHHTEKLDKGEVMIAQFTDHTSAIKVRGKAKIYTRHGIVDTDE
jgi:transcription attenuation protein (tryptophan RNA-binding attenuator protein)